MRSTPYRDRLQQRQALPAMPRPLFGLRLAIFYGKKWPSSTYSLRYHRNHCATWVVRRVSRDGGGISVVSLREVKQSKTKMMLPWFGNPPAWHRGLPGPSGPEPRKSPERVRKVVPGLEPQSFWTLFGLRGALFGDSGALRGRRPRDTLSDSFRTRKPSVPGRGVPNPWCRGEHIVNRTLTTAKVYVHVLFLLNQGGPSSVRFGHGSRMERFERFWFSVPKVPLRGGLSGPVLRDTARLSQRCPPIAR